MAGLRFFDITDTGMLEDNAKAASFMRKPFPKLGHHKTVEKVFANLTIDGPVENLQKFTSFRTRREYI